jgi:uncharacterized protein (TIGR03437 family)
MYNTLIRTCLCVIVAAVSIGAAFAQAPAVATGGIVNHFSYAVPGLPNGDIAQGSIFDIYGTNIGPATLTALSGFPIPTVLANTTVKVTVSGTTVDVYLFFVSAGQIAGVLPSNTPVGTGTLTVTVNGQTSAPAPIRVVARSIGILSLNQAGNGPAVMQMPDGAGGVPLNSVAAPIKPLGVGVFYGTGAGGVTFDETNAAPLQDLGSNTQIRALVGGKTARLLYAGRAPGFVGLDQFNVEIPADITGCFAPVAFLTGNVISNYTTISVAPAGSACPDPKQPPDLSGIDRVGGVELVRGNTKFSFQGQTVEMTNDTFASAFTATDFSKITPGPDNISYTVGPCVLTPHKQPENPNPPDNSAAITYLDAGPFLALTGPNGNKQIARLNTAGVIGYSGPLGGGLAFPGLPPPEPLYLSPGTYTVNNGAGVPQGGVGPFQASLTIPAEFVWSNQDITTVERSQGVEVRWTGADANLIVNISGSSDLPESATQPPDAGYSFSCNAPGSAGRFTVPAEVLLSLPPSGVQEGVPTGNLSVSTLGTPVRFIPTGLDYAEFSFVVSISRVVEYK